MLDNLTKLLWVSDGIPKTRKFHPNYQHGGVIADQRTNLSLFTMQKITNMSDTSINKVGPVDEYRKLE